MSKKTLKNRLTNTVVFIIGAFFLSTCREKLPTNNDNNLSDTTSHDFVWNMDTLGAWGSEIFDVAIVNENDIWAVGYITIPDPDSSFNGTGWETFNVVHWDGEKWHLMLAWGVTPLYSIWYFNKNDIWVTLEGLPIHWDGNDWTLYHIQNMGLDANTVSGIWG